MAQQRLPVRKIREVLRLKVDGFSDRQVALSIGSARSTVQDCVRRAREAGRSHVEADESMARSVARAYTHCTCQCESHHGCAKDPVLAGAEPQRKRSANLARAAGIVEYGSDCRAPVSPGKVPQ